MMPFRWPLRHKDRLIVLLGAGSTIHAGAPATGEITGRIMAMKRHSIDTIVAALTAQRGSGNFEFETILYALEELDVYLLRKRVPEGWDLLGGVLTAFTDLMPAFVTFNRDPLLIDRYAFIAAIADFVWTRTKGSSHVDLMDFLGLLRHRFRLTVFTLNYDDIIDRTRAWFDGFTDAASGPRPHQRFNASTFRSRFHMEADGLAHLHGCVRFGRDDKGLQVVKYTNPEDAIQYLNEPDLNAPSPLRWCLSIGGKTIGIGSSRRVEQLKYQVATMLPPVVG